VRLGNNKYIAPNLLVDKEARGGSGGKAPRLRIKSIRVVRSNKYVAPEYQAKRAAEKSAQTTAQGPRSRSRKYVAVKKARKTPRQMPVCSFFLRGLCTNEKVREAPVRENEWCARVDEWIDGAGVAHAQCPYSHVKVNPNARVCEAFLAGHCPDGENCKLKHTRECQEFAKTGQCSNGDACKLKHTVRERKGRAKLVPGDGEEAPVLDSDNDNDDDSNSDDEQQELALPSTLQPSFWANKRREREAQEQLEAESGDEDSESHDGDGDDDDDDEHSSDEYEVEYEEVSDDGESDDEAATVDGNEHDDQAAEDDDDDEIEYEIVTASDDDDEGDDGEEVEYEVVSEEDDDDDSGGVEYEQGDGADNV